MIHSQTAEALAFNADRLRTAWMLRMDGKTYREIGDALGVHAERARQIVIKADHRVRGTQEQYIWAVRDPIAYGVLHVFTHEGRQELPNTTIRRFR